MNRDEARELYHGCMKLFSDNVCTVFSSLSVMYCLFSGLDFLLSLFAIQKINQKNTWELGLIDHLSEVIKVDEEEDTETNFQKVISPLSSL